MFFRDFEVYVLDGSIYWKSVGNGKMRENFIKGNNSFPNKALKIGLFWFVFFQTWALASSLDRAQVQLWFKNKNYSKAEFYLKDYLEKNEGSVSKSDKVFSFSVLSAIYGNKESTLEKARIYMWSLVEIEPDPKVEKLLTYEKGIELYQRIRQAYFQGDESVLSRDLDAVFAEKKEEKKEDQSSWLWYSLGGVGVVAVTTGIFLFSGNEPETVVYKGDL